MRIGDNVGVVVPVNEVVRQCGPEHKPRGCHEHDSNYDVAGPRTAMTQEGIHGDWSDCRASTAVRELIASLGSTRAKGNEKPPTISRRGLVCDFQGVDRISINSL
jgi:hypothetical protein